MRYIKILGTGHYLPTQIITSESLDKLMNKPNGWAEKKSGVHSRRFVLNETSSSMGALAAKEALTNANVNMNDVDCIISACGVMEQLIPTTGVLIKEKLKLNNNIPCFDVNSTCLSFLSALEMVSCMIVSGLYKKILIVSSEIPSCGLNWSDANSCTLFGDGAAAAVISISPQQDSKILGSQFETHVHAADHCTVEGGGTKLAHGKTKHVLPSHFLFNMQGKKVFKIATALLPNFVNKLLNQCHLSHQDIDWVVPHQASGLALSHMDRHLGFAPGKFINQIDTLGNQMSASIPIVLHLNIKNQKIARGQKILLLGTGAGFSMGGIVLEY